MVEGVGDGELFNRHSFGVQEDSCRDWLLNNVNVLKPYSLVHLKMMKTVNFMSHIVYLNF